MTKDQLALKISIAMHKSPNARLDNVNAYLNTYQCLSNYFKELSMGDVEGIATQYGVKA
ncbi:MULTISPECIES: hypothetical protein [unclassified Prochlorococcus]|uniref:hypothetical protein n=1 Tax=unclassified Prochlorococcus TaxID=2627481 RepID=UPI0005337ECC|nr:MULTISPECIES: hypothetical protein [unclassified Prochlorococcus]KGG16091.1 putative protein family PM-4 [Prochlorococcus sp. MIT 0602]KGG17210.1 putative protein family PM-4 [Prochlorococcus sp. MIT 0603]